MAVFSLIGAAVGSIASAVGGVAGAIGSAIGGLGTAGGLSAAAGLVGTAISGIGAFQQYRGAKRAEALRQRQMNLQAAREKRSTVRQAIVARAQALSSATSQGAAGGSAVAGGLGNIASQAGSNIQGISQGQEIGTQMFAANRQISAGQTLQSIGGGIQNVGNIISQNRDTLNRVIGW